MDIIGMKYLIEIEKSKSVTRAAANLYISQPALHKYLKKLENEFGTKLFYKKGHCSFPTETGSIILESSRKILQIYQEMNDMVLTSKTLETGKVNLGISPVMENLYLMPILKNFCKLYPGIQIHLVEDGGFSLASMTASGKTDLAFVMSPSEISSLNEIILFRDQVMVCVPHAHPWYNKERIHLQDLSEVPFVTFNNNYHIHTRLMSMLRTKGIDKSPVFEASDSSFLYRYAMNTNTALIMARPMIDICRGTDDVRLLSFDPLFPWNVSVVFSKTGYIPDAAMCLIRYLLENGFSDPHISITSNTRPT